MTVALELLLHLCALGLPSAFCARPRACAGVHLCAALDMFLSYAARALYVCQTSLFQMLNTPCITAERRSVALQNRSQSRSVALQFQHLQSGGEHAYVTDTAGLPVAWPCCLNRLAALRGSAAASRPAGCLCLLLLLGDNHSVI